MIKTEIKISSPTTTNFIQSSSPEHILHELTYVFLVKSIFSLKIREHKKVSVIYYRWKEDKEKTVERVNIWNTEEEESVKDKLAWKKQKNNINQVK